MDAMPHLDRSGFEILDEFECLRLLGSVPVGRIVFTLGGMPAVRLVNFLVDDDTIVFASDEGEKYRAAVRGDVVAFEADDIDDERHLGWTVTAVGHLSVVPPDEAAALRRTLPLHTWAPLHKQQLIRLGTESLTGRRLQPWAQRQNR